MRAREFIGELETLDEMPIPTEWPKEIFTSKTSFAKRLKYIKDHATRIGVGSSRVAYEIPYDGKPSVFKVAKNSKGLAQNKVEADILGAHYAQQLGIVIPVIDHDEENDPPIWIHMMLANKATKKQLCNLMKCNSLDDLVDYAKFIHTGKVPMWYAQDRNTYEKQFFIDFRTKKLKSENDIETMKDYATKLAELANNFNIILDDFKRIANWGIYVGNSGEKPVVIDIGFNQDVYQSHYKR